VTDAFSTSADQLRGHASSLAGYADQLANLGARLPDSLDGQSLGSFAGFLTTGLGGAMTATMDGFAHVASTVDMVSGGLRQAADDYQRTDDDSAAGLAGIQPNTPEVI
jgi:uncharacterized protein YukE